MTTEALQANRRRCSPQGYSRRFERRPEFLFGMLIDRRCLVFWHFLVCGLGFFRFLAHILDSFP